MHVHETGTGAIDRLESDLRTFSPTASSASRGAGGSTTRTRPAPRSGEAALHQIEQADLGEEWEALRLTLRELMEGSNALLSWKEEHGHEGHTAERAVYAAALALLAGERLPASTIRHAGAAARRGAALAVARDAAAAATRVGARYLDDLTIETRTRRGCRSNA